MLGIDASGIVRLSSPSGASLALIEMLVAGDHWPPRFPAAALADCLTGDPDGDRDIDALLASIDVVTDLPPAVARHAAWLRTAAGRGSATDALVVAMADPGGIVLAGDRAPNIEALALQADDVYVERL